MAVCAIFIKRCDAWHGGADRCMLSAAGRARLQLLWRMAREVVGCRRAGSMARVSKAESGILGWGAGEERVSEACFAGAH